MKILHTSDWHIGRSFHAHSTLEHLQIALDALVAAVTENNIDVVVVSGDIFDSATPAAENYDVLTSTLIALRDAGAVVILTSGNHDSATRLGFNSGFTGAAGIHIITRHDQHDRPITVTDDHGPVHFYGIPYLEPSLIRHHYPDTELRSHAQVLQFVMDRIRTDIGKRNSRSVVMSHAFIANVPTVDASASEGVERDITAGGLDYVPLSTFDGADYVALGHIHGRATLSPHVRYSGAPLHYSFSEGHKPRGAWIVTLDAAGLDNVEWLELPIPRRLTVLTGTLEQLITTPANAEFENDWISAILTDQVRPLDAMRRLQTKFPFAAHLGFAPSIVAGDESRSYGERLASKSDPEIVDDFLALVRNGFGATAEERTLITEIVNEQTASA